MQEYVKIKNSKPTQVGRSAGKPSQQEKMQAGFKLKKGKSKAKTNAWSFATHLFKWKDWFTTAGLAGCMWQAGARSHTSRMTPAGLAAAAALPAFGEEEVQSQDFLRGLRLQEPPQHGFPLGLRTLSSRRRLYVMKFLWGKAPECSLCFNASILLNVGIQSRYFWMTWAYLLSLFSVI